MLEGKQKKSLMIVHDSLISEEFSRPKKKFIE